MKNILLFSDIHINIKELDECRLVLDEIRSLCNRYTVDTVFNLGDTFDKINPESECLDLFSGFVQDLQRPIWIIAANSHESSTETESVLNHFGILNGNAGIIKEFKDEDFMYCGHFSLKESCINFDAKLSRSDLENYKYVFLGHVHNYQIIKPNIAHLGSCRYVDFAESEDKAKIVCLIEKYKTEKQKVHFLRLSSPYSMRDITVTSSSISPEGETSKKTFSLESCLKELDTLDAKTKVRLLFNDFESYSQFINKYSYYKDKFILFKDKKNFTISDNTQFRVSSEKTSLKEALNRYLEMSQINASIRDILNEEIK